MSDSEKRKTSDDVDDKNKYRYRKISGKAWGVLQFKKLRSFPFSVFFIVGNEFCERFSYYGLRAVLVLFLLNQLEFSENSSTAIYHGFIVLCYLLPLFGAVISDSCLGKYKTILSLSVVYAIGNIIVSISAIPFVHGINIALVMVGLFVIAIGTGGIKPCVSAFGGDQFQESQSHMLRRFFALFYFSINAGSVISTLLTPVLRSYVHCFDLCECFALAFGIPAILMFVSLVIFVLGTRFYIIKKPQKESSQLYVDVPFSIASAIICRIKHGKVPGKKLLHYAAPKYSVDFLNDVGLFLKVLVMFLPLPIFWALFDQQGSRWTLQANRMNGRLGKFTIQPDQMQALNPILILVFIPIFETVVYPIFAKCHLLKRPLQRMVVGMILAGLAFVVAGAVQLKLDSAQETLNYGESKLMIYNHAPFSISFDIKGANKDFASTYTLDNGEDKIFPSITSGEVEVQIMSSSNFSLNCSLELQELNITQLYIVFDDFDGLSVIKKEYREDVPDGGHSNVQVINLVDNDTLSDLSVIILPEGGASSSECNADLFNTSELTFGDASQLESITFGRYIYGIKTYEQENTSKSSSESGSGQPWYRLYTYESSSFENDFEGGAIYAITVTENSENQTAGKEQYLKYNLTVIEIDPPNSVSIFLQVPMYILITAGEVMFSVTGLEFAYSQAPVSMKAMCQAAWLLTVAGGNFVVIIIAESSAFKDRALEFFFFAILIGVVTLVFAIMSYFYKYVNDKEISDGLKEDESTALIPDQNTISDNIVIGKTGEGDLHNEKDISNSESEF